MHIDEMVLKKIAMYAKGMTVRDIQSHLEDMYEADISTHSF